MSGITLLKNTTQQLGLQFFYCAGQAASCLANNGNVMGQKITIPEAATPWNWSYGYDGMNRLTSAEESGTNAVKQYYGYDAWGNRAVESTSTYVPDTGITPQAVAGSGTVPFNANNQWTGASYDTAGFQLTNFGTLQTPNNAQYTYDAEGRLETAVVPERGTIRYTYDGEGRRVKSQVGTAQTVYVYDAAGQLAAEYGGSVAGSGTQYLTADHLGSTRLVTDAAGAMVRRSDYLPYGEEIAVPGDGTAGPGGRTLAMGYRASDALDQADVVSQKFTAKERDAETGLDYFGARYLSGAQGRFTSPDPGAYKLEDPQTFNRYAYVINNPLKHIDPTGREAEYLIDEKKRTIKLRASIIIYGPQATPAYAAKLKTQIESAWKGTYKDPKTGTVYKVSTSVEVSVYNPLLGVGLLARNGFYVGDNVTRSNFENRHTDRRFPSRFPGDPGVYTGALRPAADAERHEGGHVLGEPDDYYEDSIRGIMGPQPGHAGHLMADLHARVAAQDEIDRIGSFTLNQMRATHKTEGTIITLPEPPRPR